MRHPARDERSHPLELRDVAPHRLRWVLLTTYERAPQDFETLLGTAGVGRVSQALRAVREEHGTEAGGGRPWTTMATTIAKVTKT